MGGVSKVKCWMSGVSLGRTRRCVALISFWKRRQN